MNIKFIGRHLSITDFEWINIPKFVVLTGINGAGKSQLLDLLKTLTDVNNGKHRGLEISNEVIEPNEITYLQSRWELQNTSPVDLSTIQGNIRELHNVINRNRNANSRFYGLAKEVEKTGRDISTLTQDEFINILPANFVIEEYEITVKMASLFVQYKLGEIEAKYYGREAEYLETQGAPPWQLLKDILKEANLKFKFSEPDDSKDFGYKTTFNFKIYNDKGEMIEFSNLSSGEKVLISLVFFLYNSKSGKKLPKLFLLDEPDAHLHPSMTQQFINVMKNVLVDQYGVRVIMTSHSPSTVALSPQESIFIMDKGNPRIRPCSSKNEAISLLTSGIVFVGQGTKYVLVEDTDDQIFYTELYEHLIDNKIIKADIPVVFIPASTSDKSGGKTVVNSWVDKFSKADLKAVIQGLIDLDSGNAKSDGIHLLNRYSIENYLLDPIIVYAACMTKNKQIQIDGIDLKFGEEFKLESLTDKQLQVIADHIHNEIKPTLNSIPNNNIALDYSYICESFTNNHNLSYPKWLLSQRGKNLLNLYRSKYGINFDDLMNSMKRIHFIPVDIKSLFQEIQKTN
jgi:ABC-type Mn2+/Zn2+ transport system ATPase subunit